MNNAAIKEPEAEMTNEEYRKELQKIFAKIDSTRKLRFWYRYISGVEKGRT